MPRKRRVQRAPDTSALKPKRVSPMERVRDRAFAAGYNECKEQVRREQEARKPELKDSLLMTLQRLGDANAQMATVFGKILERM